VRCTLPIMNVDCVRHVSWWPLSWPRSIDSVIVSNSLVTHAHKSLRIDHSLSVGEFCLETIALLRIIDFCLPCGHLSLYWWNFQHIQLSMAVATIACSWGFVAFTPLTFKFEVFWVVTPCSVVVGYQRWYTTTTLHGVTAQKTWECLSCIRSP
jgi:hypothetical protein